MVPSAASAYRRHDSGFSSLDKNDSLSDFRDSVQETEIGVSGITTCDVGAARTELPVHVVDAHVHSVSDTCPRPTTTTEVSDISDRSSVEEFDGETLETGAIRKCYSDLSNAISQQLDVVSSELYSCDLIERTKLDQILAVSGISDRSMAIRVLNAALTKMESVSSKFHEFLSVLEKCGICEIAERIRAKFDEQSRAHELKQRLSPVGGSDGELMCNTGHRPSLAGDRHKKHYRRETSHPNLKITMKNNYSGRDVQDDVVQRQVRQLNIDVLKLSKENRRLQQKIEEQENTIKEMDAAIQKQDTTIMEQDATIKDLKNSYHELLASYRNLEIRNNLLLSHSRSLLSLNSQEDTDYPYVLSRTRHTLRAGILSTRGHTRGWAGCEACCRRGNTRCRESTV